LFQICWGTTTITLGCIAVVMGGLMGKDGAMDTWERIDAANRAAGWPELTPLERLLVEVLAEDLNGPENFSTTGSVPVSVAAAPLVRADTQRQMAKKFDELAEHDPTMAAALAGEVARMYAALGRTPPYPFG
jgi:hypothetical protein